MTNLDKDKIVADFTEAYSQVNGKAPSIEAKSGWYSVDGGKNIRLAQLQEMTESLLSQSGSATKKPATKTAKAAKSSSAKKPSKKSAAFSVKQYWAEKLKAEAPGAILPR
ncbi:hypothetical protein D210916BOD24_14480 [Alteromonas sp. D210916BOD_24]|uniref:hypothetical protein n=1 Tax=Alteromonas sp. D210916BOD_24 TaxID=3157618 RepID=UPI00399C8FAD